MPRPRVHGLESYKDIPLDHPLRRKIQNRNAQRTFRKKRAASNGQEVEQATNEQAESAGGGATVDTGSASAESGVSAENKSNSINVEPWVIPVVSSPQDLNIDSLDLEPHEAVGSGAVDQMDNTNGMSQPDSVSFSRPTSHPQLDAGFLDPVDLYASHTITNQEGFPPPFSVNGTETQFDFEPEWQPVQSQIQLQVPGTSRKQSRRRPSQTLSSKSHAKSARSRHSGSNSTTEGGFQILGDARHQSRSRPRLDVLNSPCPAKSEHVAARPAASSTTGPFPGISAAGGNAVMVRPPPVHKHRPVLPLSAQSPSAHLPLAESGGRESSEMQTSSNSYPTGHQHHQKRQRSPILCSNMDSTSIYTTKQQPVVNSTSQEYPITRGHRNSIAFSMASSSTEPTSSLHSSNGGSGTASYDDGTAVTSMTSSAASSPMSISIPIKAAAEPISSSGGDEKAGAKGGDQSWRHIIHTCCEVGHISLVEELVESGLDIEKRDSAGNTPLHIAANAGHEEIMAYLLEKGCNVDAVNNAGWTAAHLATAKGHRGCLRLLLELNASPWARVNTSSL